MINSGIPRVDLHRMLVWLKVLLMTKPVLELCISTLLLLLSRSQSRTHVGVYIATNNSGKKSTLSIFKTNTTTERQLPSHFQNAGTKERISKITHFLKNKLDIEFVIKVITKSVSEIFSVIKYKEYC